MRKPCLVCGVVTDGPSWCPQHIPVRKRPAGRYNYRWRKASKAARTAQPWCSRCGSTIDLTGDHVLPMARGGERNPEVEDIVVLCRRCNSSKGAR
jgi:5-methylcytosine-specific restriction endonuclease McrA